MSGVVLVPGLVRVTAGARAAIGDTEDAVVDTVVVVAAAALGVVIMAVADALVVVVAAAAAEADALAAGKYFQHVKSIVDMLT